MLSCRAGPALFTLSGRAIISLSIYDPGLWGPAQIHILVAVAHPVAAKPGAVQPATATAAVLHSHKVLARLHDSPVARPKRLPAVRG